MNLTLQAASRWTPLFLTLFLVACGPPEGGPQALPAAPSAQVAAPATRASAQVAAPVTHAARGEETLLLERRIAADFDPASRRAAIDAYADGHGERRELLRSLGSESDPVVRRWAALAMARQAGPEEAQALSQLALSEPDPAVKNVLLRALRRSER